MSQTFAWLDLSESLVVPGTTIRVTIVGPPHHLWGIGWSRHPSGLTVDGVALDLGQDTAVVASGQLDAEGRAVVSFTPPVGDGTPTIYLQGATAAAAGSALTFTPGKVVRDLTQLLPAR